MQLSRSILLVDDNALSRLLLRDTLEREAYRLLEAKDGAEALAVIATARPDLVVLDLVMPVMGGLELLAEIRRMPAPPRVVVISSVDSESLAQQTIASGATRFIAKPFRQSDVVSEIARAFDT
jgi:two-component system chemotaxis response regulator CheY